MKTRLGHRMRVVIDFVRKHPGCSKHAAGKAADLDGLPGSGRKSVNRAIASGYLCEHRLQRRFALYVNDPAPVVVVHTAKMTAHFGG